MATTLDSVALDTFSVHMDDSQVIKGTGVGSHNKHNKIRKNGSKTLWTNPVNDILPHLLNLKENKSLTYLPLKNDLFTQNRNLVAFILLLKKIKR